MNCQEEYDHIRDDLILLYWLPVRSRIVIKSAVLTLKVLATNQPTYLREPLVIHEPNRSLSSCSQIFVQKHNCRMIYQETRYFVLSVTINKFI